MNYELAIIEDRLNDLESKVTELSKTISKQRKHNDANIKAFNSTLFFLLPLVAIALISMGLKFDYHSDKHHISYANDSLVELAISGLTLISGIYTIKKHRDKEHIQRSDY